MLRRLAGMGIGGWLLVVAGCSSGSAPAPPARPVSVSPPAEACQVPSRARLAEIIGRTESKAPERPRLRIAPGDLTIEADDPGVQLLVQVEGEPGDRTGKVEWRVEPEGVVSVSESGYVRPEKGGEAKIRARQGEDEAEILVRVADREERTWDFEADVVPIFTRYGCNGGGCHGRAAGQNGFHLSLFGYDPEGDFEAITRQEAGRRIDGMAPEASLLLQKATGMVAHGGGRRISEKSDAYGTLLSWIEAGAPRLRGESHGELAEVRVEPSEGFLRGPGPRQLRVVARYEDGHERDVTRLATYASNDDQAVSVDETGLATLLRRAETDVVVRYQSEIVARRVATAIDPDCGFDFASLKRRNFIDEELFKRLETLGVPPSAPASDAAFLRRVSLDLTGQMPQPGEIKGFEADGDPEKRAKKVDELMERREFLLFWRLKFGDMLQISQARFPEGYGPYEYWLNERLEANAPWDQMVRELLTSLGDPRDVKTGGPVNYAMESMGDAKAQAELAAQRFLGLRLRCAQCHDHPFDVWTQDDYFGLAAIFAKVDASVPRGAMAMMSMRPKVRVNPDGKVEHLRTHEPAEMRLLSGKTVEVEPGEDPRRALADWITSEENPYFSKAFANWVWAQFFGRGLVNPPDDMSVANPAVHPELLEALAEHLREQKYDLRELIRTIATSEAYGLSSRPVEGNRFDARLFSHHQPRPLTAHQMADAIAQATNVPDRFPNRSARSRTKAIEIFDPGTPSVVLDTFGRCPRNKGCSPVANPQLSLKQALLLIGGDVVDGKVSSLNGYLMNLLALKPTAAEVVEFLYYRTLCRPPSEEELSHWTAVLEGSGSLQEASEDLFWALLNSKEFAFNH